MRNYFQCFFHHFFTTFNMLLIFQEMHWMQGLCRFTMVLKPHPFHPSHTKHILPYHLYCMVYIYLHELVDFYGIYVVLLGQYPNPMDLPTGSHGSHGYSSGLVLCSNGTSRRWTQFYYTQSLEAQQKTVVSWKNLVGSLVGVFSTTEKLEKQILKQNFLGAILELLFFRFWLSIVLGMFGLVFADLDDGSQKHLRKGGFSELTCKLSKAEWLIWSMTMRRSLESRMVDRGGCRIVVIHEVKVLGGSGFRGWFI